MRGLAWVTALSLVAGACGGSSSSSSSSAGVSATAESSGGSASTSTSATGDGTTAEAGTRRSGLSIHLQNIHAGGALPSDADPAVDHLEVSFQMVLTHNGTEPLSGIAVHRARLVHDDGREIVFGVMSEEWDGRLAATQERTLSFHKTPDSANPPARRSFCGQHMRLEITLELVGRTTTAQSRRVQIECPGTPTG